MARVALNISIASGLNFELAQMKLEDWLVTVRAEAVTNVTATIAVSAGPREWYVVRFIK